MEQEDEDYLVETRKTSKCSRGCAIFALIVSLCIGFLLGYVVSMTIHKKSTTKRHDVKYDKFHNMVKNSISNSRIEANLRSFTEKSHRAGGQNSYSFAQTLKQKWSSYGLDNVEIKQYNVMLSKPKSSGFVSVKTSNSTELYRTHLNETVLIPGENVEHVVPFNAYSAKGVAQGPIVYINYGKMEDFHYLRQHNISLKGKIALCRYGRIFRANKVKLAEEAGAIGVILYSDPAEYSVGSIKYPQTWWLPPDGVQRGTISLLGADPQTLGAPAIDGIYRLNENNTDTPKIPVHPISYSDALEIMKYMDGTVAPKEWQGGLNFTYRINTSVNNTKTFTLNVDVVKTVNQPVYDVIGKVVGAVEPDRIVMLGVHHDAWVMGGLDPESGTAVLNEVVRAVGVAVKKGWKPRRTIMFCSWDAEEYGLIGSTEWIEEHASLISNQVVSYLNVDSAVQGNFTLSAKSSSQIATVLFQAADQVEDPDAPGSSLLKTWTKKTPEKKNMEYPSVRVPGSGSDFETFFVRFGIPVTDIRYTYDRDSFDDTPSPATYHSLHDTFYFAQKFMDPDFTHCAAVGKVWSLTASLLADSAFLPFNFTDYARRLQTCHDDFLKEYSMITSIKVLREGFGYVTKAIQKFSTVAEEFHQRISKIDTHDDLQVRMMNDKMMAVERAFIAPHGLPGRPYIKHVLYGPSRYNSYRGNCFPALVDDLLEGKYYDDYRIDQLRRDISQIYQYILQGVQVLRVY
ncbi:N-acetylated-alpha-linked acidic dipeptidase 2-like [Hydractinia symbiolongicarpus]|uniref:N-acetylated-alpha-linked acidic dipeptidase 2-like n=1 Tax=Hydractinia symbiolongicarpus TaxID=13093 RepID=UPI00254E24CA|nr:N-acetylated-alpha-linked acidic dipeptidase 2-like [Hydractinia symbiolongicarpus]